METYNDIVSLVGLRDIYVFGLNMSQNYTFSAIVTNPLVTSFFTGALTENIIDEWVRPRQVSILMKKVTFVV
jgi:hypothetical protein